VSACALCRLSGHKSSSHWFEQIARIDIAKFPTREAALKTSALFQKESALSFLPSTPVTGPEANIHESVQW
jgi:hypothetical protein